MFRGTIREVTRGTLIVISILALAACSFSDSGAAASTTSAAATSSTNTSSSALSASSFTVIDHCCRPKVDFGKISATPGAVWPFQDPVYDATNTDVIGSDLGECARIDPTRLSWECHWTTFLSDGQISVEGPFFDNKPSTLVVTGGSGAYAAATGTMELQCGNGECKYVFNLI